MGRKLYAKGQNFNPTTGIDDVEGLREELDALKGGTSGGGGDTIEIERRLTTAEDEINALQGDVAEQSKEIAKIGSKVSTLQGSDTGKSVRAIAAEETAKIVGGAPANYDTLKEIADYISADATGAAELKNKVNKNAQDIGNLKTTTDQLEESMQDLRSEVGENYAAFIEEIGVIDNKDKSQDTRIENVEDRVTDLETEVYHPDRGNEVLHRVVWGVDSRVDELENNVNNKASKSEAQSYANTAETNAKEYADSLSGNYDAKGSAANAVQSAKTYTDTKINEVNSDIDSLTSNVEGKLGKEEQAADSAKLGGKLASEYMPKSGGTFTGAVKMNAYFQLGNNKPITIADTDGVYQTVLYLSGANNLMIGYGTSVVGKRKTVILGNNIEFRSAGNDTTTLVLNTDRTATFIGNVTAPNFCGGILSALPSAVNAAALVFTRGQYDVTAEPTADKIYVGSDANRNVISVATIDSTASRSNVCNLRLTYNSAFFSDIAMYPNSGKKLWYRNVQNGVAGAWKQFVFEDNNATNWKININGVADSANMLRDIETFTFNRTTASEYVLLLSDLTPDWDKTTGATHCGFSGMVLSARTNGYPEDYIAFIEARTGYNYSGTASNNRVLTSSHPNLIPRIVKYANSYYIGISIKGNDRRFTFVGKTFNLLSSLLSVPATDVEVLYEGTLGYSGVMNRSIYADGVRENSSTRGTTANVGSKYGNDRALHYFIATSSITDGSAPEGHILHMSWDSGATAGMWAAQLLVSHTSARGLQRRYTGSTHSWSPWIDILDANNFHNYALPIKGGTIDGNLKVTADIDANEIHVREIECYQNAVIDGLLSTENLEVWSDAVIHGSMTANTSFHSSDDRLKTYEEDVDIDLERIKKLPKKYFHWTSDADGKRQLGTSAQAVREIYPELVNEDKDGYLSVNYANLSVVALAAVDKLAEQNKALEERLKRIEKLLNIE